MIWTPKGNRLARWRRNRLRTKRLNFILYFSQKVFFLTTLRLRAVVLVTTGRASVSVAPPGGGGSDRGSVE
jgi:hypothetical protein